MEFAGNLLRDTFDAAMGFKVDFLGRVLYSGITGVYSGKFNVFADGVEYDFALLGDGIKFDFFGFLNKLGDNNRVLLADIGGQTEEALKLFGVGTDVHGGTAEDIGRADEDRETHLADKGVDVFQGGKFFPAGLINVDTVKET